MTIDALPRLPAYTNRLLETARSLDNPTAPSLCPGWTRGHILTHLARNADGLARLVRSVVDGTGETMYASDTERDAEIEDGAARDLPELVADVESAARLMDLELARLGPRHRGVMGHRTPGGREMDAGAAPTLRLREVAYHHVDLDAGFGFADLDADLVRAYLEAEIERLRDDTRTPPMVLVTGDGERWPLGESGPEVIGSRAALLGWLGRGLTDGLTATSLPALPPGP